MLARVSSRAWAVALHCSRLLLVDMVFAFLDITVKICGILGVAGLPSEGCFCCAE